MHLEFARGVRRGSLLRSLLSLLVGLVVCTAARAAASPDDAARAFLAEHEAAVVDELRELLRLPNVAPALDDLRANARLLTRMLTRRGIHAEMVETPGAMPVVYGELLTPNATRTLVFYAHFDGQPVGDAQTWRSPPFEPTLRAGRVEDGAAVVAWDQARYPLPDDMRIYARSASDDKAPIVAMLAALDALRMADVPLSVNLKFFLDGEEEAGSPHLARILHEHRDRLDADLWVFADGPIDPRGLPRAVLGARGVMSFQITVFGAAYSLHSGHYGNVAPNPGARLAHVIASMRDEDGRILIDGFAQAQTPVSEQTLALAREAFDDASMLAGPRIARTESGASYGESLLRCALNVSQLRYGGSGPARNAIDPQAQASFDLRLVPGVGIAQAREFIAAHLRQQGYHLVDDVPNDAERAAHDKLAQLTWSDSEGYPAAAVAPDAPAVARAIAVLRDATDDRIRIVPLLGGSLPIAPIVDVLDAPFVVLPTVNPDNNQHAPNENLRLREFREAVRLFAVLIATYGAMSTP
jgi:acetylornithine deacetylase/succinyl-diaminopimelate desuccinylase-like protein